MKCYLSLHYGRVYTNTLCAMIKYQVLKYFIALDCVTKPILDLLSDSSKNSLFKNSLRTRTLDSEILIYVTNICLLPFI